MPYSAPDPIGPLREQLAHEIMALVSHLSSQYAARVLGVDEARVADLRHGRWRRFSLERLIRILANLQRRVDLIVVNTGPAQKRWPVLRPEAPQRRRKA